jgi:hypothetical protein
MAVREVPGSAVEAELKAAKGALVVIDWCATGNAGVGTVRAIARRANVALSPARRRAASEPCAPA